MTTRTTIRRLAAASAVALAAGLMATGLTSSPAAAAPSTVDPSAWPTLAARLQPVIDDAKANGVEVGLFVADLQGAFGKARLHLGQQGKFTTASTIKLSLAATVMHQVQSGELTLGDMVTLDPADKIGGTGELQNNPFPQDVTVGRMLELMITVSDNTATNKLVDVVGGFGRINALTESAGIAKGDLHFGRKMFGTIVLPDGDIWATPHGFEQLLDLFYNTSKGRPTAGFLTKVSAGHLLGLMQRQKVNTKLGAVVPSGIVAHKTGENDTVSHDIGYYFIAGSDLSIGVFTRNAGGYDSAAWANVAVTYVQRIGALVYAEQLRGASPMATVTKLTLSKKRMVRGKKAVRATIAVSASTGTPGGSVMIKVGAKKLRATLVSGRATVALPKRLAVGTRKVVVSFVPANAKAYAASSSAVRKLKVVRR